MNGVVALVHGGFWQKMYGPEGFEPHCDALRVLGYTAINVRYRRVGERGGGFPNTCKDVVASLREAGPLTAVVGHSAGGQLALWAAKELTPRPRVVITVAGVNDLTRAHALGYGRAQIERFAGSKISAADPVARVPIGTHTVLVSPTADYPEGRELSTTYAAAARAAGDHVDIVEPEGDHYSLMDTGSAVWDAVLAAIAAAPATPRR